MASSCLNILMSIRVIAEGGVDNDTLSPIERVSRMRAGAFCQTYFVRDESPLL